MMFRNVRIGVKLGLGFGFSMIVIALLMAIPSVQFTRLHGTSQQIQETSFPFAILAQEMVYEVVQVQQFLTDVSATHEPDGYRDAEEAARRFMAGADKFEALYRSRNDVASLRFMEGLKGDFTAYYELGKRMANAYVTGGVESGNAIMKDFDKASESLAGKALKFKEAQIAEADVLARRMAASMATARLILLVIGGGALLVTLVMSVVVTRSITNPLAEAVAIAGTIARGDLTVTVVPNSNDEPGRLLEAMRDMVTTLKEMVAETAHVSAAITAAAEELTATSNGIASGAEAVASQAGTVATASEEMSCTSADIARNCTMAADASRQTSDSAATGAGVVNESIAGMDLIAERVRTTARTVEALGVRSQQIGDIVGTIEDIADQTNLLALNAAIEAARAGEQGRGFAVVADEVRALAERTTKATGEIGEMIKAIQQETRHAVTAMEDGVREVERGAESSQKSGRALGEILDRINEVSLQISQIAAAAEEQTATTNEVTRSVLEITNVVQHSARGAEKTAGAASLLAKDARQLQSLVGRFRL
ncbi:MAG TPA: methyl-accepting chemotaxis protein [Desulfuromonadaceae bacterium]